MANARDIKTDNIKLKMLLYGKSGTGKTTAACSMPKPFVYDFDSGMLSVRGKNVDYETFKGKSAYQDFEVMLAQHERSCPYETLVLDSVTTMQEYMMAKILQANKRKVRTLGDWGSLVNDLTDLFMRMSKMTKHFVVIAHEQMMQDELSGEIHVQPLIVGKKLPPMLPLWFDEVYRTQTARDAKGKPVYQVMTRADTRYMAKSRLGYLEPMEDVSKDGEAISLYEVITRKGETSE